MTIDGNNLKQKFVNEGWEVNTTVGKSKPSFEANRGEEHVFVKSEPITPALVMLSEIGIAVPIKSVGEFEDKQYFIQDFFEGKYPDENWFATHIEELAKYIRKYHDDKRLTEILSEGEADFNVHVENEIRKVINGVENLKLDKENENVFKESVIRMEEMGTKLLPVELVPVHADTNNANFLVNDEKLYMVDWEDVFLSDPIRDIGMILFRFYPKEKWGDFIKAYGEELDEDRLYFWIARECLGIAQWFGNMGDISSQNTYLEAFESASNKENNPHYGKL
ncbi:MAG: phosphotransferase [Candidatus Shapirobacteria bacterium]